jgi:hypothetical protein
MPSYGGAMSEAAANPFLADSVEYRLRDALHAGDAVLAAAGPVLRHLLSSDESGLFGDAVIARVRGMASDVARQLFGHLAVAGGEGEGDGLLPGLTAAIVAQPGFLGHVHALALEWQLAEALQERLALDPVLSPLLQALIGSSEPATGELAMKFLAAQARFCQAQRRMRLPLGELPGDLLHGALVAMRTVAGVEPDVAARAAEAEASIRSVYDESRSRLGLISRLVTSMGPGAIAALSVEHAGAAIFLSALAAASAQDRDLAVLATSDSQRTRLALALSAAGLKFAAIEEQLLTLDPDFALPLGFDRLGPDRAAAILAEGSY